jgi:hypothetical protein
MSFGRMWGKKEQGMAYLRLSPGYGGTSDVCVGETGPENGVETEKADKNGWE